MAVTTVAQLAAELNRPASTLLEQLQAAGVNKASAEDSLNESDKERLLDHLRTAHGTGGAERKKITLTRKSTSEIKQADASGKARTIQVEVRKKRTFVKREDGVDDAAAAAAEEAELKRREEEAQAQAEALRQQEEELARKMREREDAERAAREAEEKRREEERAAREAAEAAAAEAAAKAAAEEEARKAADAAKSKAEKAADKAAEKAKAAAAPAPAPAPAPVAAAPAPAPAPVEPAKPVLRVVKAADVAADEKARQAELERRRKAAEAEAAAIRAMMNAPKKVLVAKKEEPKPEAAAAGIKGTIHKKPGGAPGAAGTTAAAGAGAKPGDKKSVKSEKLSSSWADDAKKRGAPGKPGGRTDGPGARPGSPGWRAPGRGGPAGRRGGRDDRGASHSNFQAPNEPVIQEVHVPETISVADLAHKMSVKASEVIKQLMKLGQMVTINQQLDQETAMILVEEMGHKAFAAKLDDPDAFLEEEGAAAESQHELLPRAPVVTDGRKSAPRKRREGNVSRTR